MLLNTPDTSLLVQGQGVRYRLIEVATQLFSQVWMA